MSHDEIERIALEACAEYKKENRSLYNTYFYKVVLSGNDDVIKKVVTYMENHEKTETLDWLFRRNDFNIPRQKQQRSQLVSCIITFRVILVNILLTPILYAVHSITAYIHSVCISYPRMSDYIVLPSVYAAFSQRKEMLEFFLSQGVETTQPDSHGNNVFHYIADLSSTASDRAIQIFHNMVTQMKGKMKTVRTLLLEDRNSAGFTAIEHVAKFGSPALFSQFLMHATVFSASKDRFNMPKDDDISHEDIWDEDTRDEDTRDEDTRDEDTSAEYTLLEEVDVTMYEAGSIRDSSLLNILCDRDVTSMSESDLKIFNDDEFLGIWLEAKWNRMIKYIVLFLIFDFFVTCLTVYIFASVYDNNVILRFHEWTTAGVNNIQLLELRAWADNTSEIFEPSVYRDRVMTTSLELQGNVLSGILAESPSELQHLLNITSLDHMLLTPDTKALSDWNISSSVGDYARAMDILYEVAKEMMEFSGNMHDWRIARLYPRFVQKLAAKVYENIDWFRESLYNKKNTTLFEKFTLMDDDGGILNPPVNFSIDSFVQSLCPSLHELKQSDFRHLFRLPIENFQTDHREINACLYTIWGDWSNPFSLPDTDVFHIVQKDDTEVSIVAWVTIICVFFYIVLDIIERCMFFCNLGHVRKVPGSYLYKQLNVLSLITFLITFLIRAQMTTFEELGTYEFLRNAIEFKNATEYNLYFYEYLDLISVVSAVFRLVMFVHKLHIVPLFGHFIIATFMMAATILKFCITSGMVVFFFSFVFSVVIENPENPFSKPGFATVTDSFFSTFQLMFGRGEMGPLFSTPAAKLTYALYMLIVVLLLINLIIAIMGTTVTKIMADPRKNVIFKIECLKEVASAEWTVVHVSKFMKLLHLIRNLGSTQNFDESTVKSYKIKRFYSPAMRDHHVSHCHSTAG